MSEKINMPHIMDELTLIGILTDYKATLGLHGVSPVCGNYNDYDNIGDGELYQENHGWKMNG